MSAELAGRTCWMCRSLIDNRRPRMIRAWKADTLFSHEWACEACWQRVAVDREVSLERDGELYVVRCVSPCSAAVSPTSGAAGSPA